MIFLIRSLFIAMFLTNVSAMAVDYGGEKSFLVEVKYEVCIIPPQVSEAEAKGIDVISVEEAKELYDAKAHFYDARSPRHYETQHIKGAYAVTFDSSIASYVALELPEDKDEPLVFYCYGESCANSYEAALAVRKSGYSNVHWLLNGFKEWKDKSFPVGTGR